MPCPRVLSLRGMLDAVALLAPQALPQPTAPEPAQRQTVLAQMLKRTRCSNLIDGEAQQAPSEPEQRQRAVPAQVAPVAVQAQVRARQPAAEPQVERSASYCPSCLQSSLRRVQN